MASRGINKVILVGRLGQDPETRHLPSGGAVTNASLATSESWTDKSTGQPVERTEWHRVVFFNRLGEIAGEYLRKGSQVYVEGSLRTRKWQDQNGNDRYSTEIVASEMQMLGGRPDGAAPSAGAGMAANAPQPASPQMQNQAAGGMGQAQMQPQAMQQQAQGMAPQQGMQQQPQHAQQGMAPQQGMQQQPQTQPFQQQAAAPMDMGSFDDDIPF